VLPRSRGGPHTWENVVASCRACNSRKEDRLPNECGMTLRRVPVAPHATTSLIAAAGPIDPVWNQYIGPSEQVSA
jgi:5-methylcytosine-specific restriction endonuclease McrA